MMAGLLASAFKSRCEPNSGLYTQLRKSLWNAKGTAQAGHARKASSQAIQTCLYIGQSVKSRIVCQEPCESRGSRTVL